MCTRSPLVDVKAGLRIPILSSSDDQSHKSRSFNNKYMKKLLELIGFQEFFHIFAGRRILFLYFK